jgi:hypothetical protein
VEGISDIHIIGIDPRRPPRIRKGPYINLFFQLNHKVPADWAEGFNRLLSKHRYTPKIVGEEWLYIDTWVRTPDEIPGLLETLRKNIMDCNRDYIARIEGERLAATKRVSTSDESSGEQAHLDGVLSRLKFGPPRSI